MNSNSSIGYSDQNTCMIRYFGSVYFNFQMISMFDEAHTIIVYMLSKKFLIKINPRSNFFNKKKTSKIVF